MPPIRVMPTKPMRTERTHEENQERAYIAASRRSDRSLEARVESARRASEIHKKRTGRSLRVREEDVMNEEMYEEEDDDLPMQYRRISALNPGFLNGRLSAYLVGQAGIKSALHDAIYNANQNNQQYQQNPYFNPMMNQNGMQQSPMMSPHAFMNPMSMQNPQYPMQNMQMRPNVHHRASSIATPQELLGFSQQNQNANMNSATANQMDSRRMSVPASAISPGVPSPATSHPQSATSSQPPTPHPVSQSPQQMPVRSSSSGQESYRASVGAPPMPGYDAHIESSVYPFSTKLPLNTAQLMGSNATHPSQLSPGIASSSMGAYSYNPNGKPKRSASDGMSSYFNNGLDQTLSSADMYPSQSSIKNEPESAVSAPPNFNENDFDALMFSHMGDDTKNVNDMGFDFTTGEFGNSGQITPADHAEFNWGEDNDLFDYDDAAAAKEST